ncbi:MAG: hypothetical protein NT069_31125 [Planctomycetota bacterium]|nr:hypothetical protein [Planctomycetota bacterium]
MPAAAPTDATTCPHCQATVGAKWTYCWLCNQPLSGEGADLPPQTLRTSTGTKNLMSLTTKVVGGAVGAGLVLVAFGLLLEQEYGGILLMLVVLFPPAIYTGVKALDGRKTGDEPQTLMHHAGVFMASLAVTLSTLSLIAVAIGIALFVACLAICASMNAR